VSGKPVVSSGSAGNRAPLLRRAAGAAARIPFAATHPVEALRAALPPELKRRLVPASISASLLAHCGGTDWRTRRFAGNLLDPDLPEQDLLRIYHSLIFPNGVRKTSGRARNTRRVKELLERGELALPRALRVLDVGSSLGLDAVGTLEALRERGHEVREYVLGDLYPRILYDRERGLVFDEDGHLLQVRRRHSFVAVNFAYDHAFQRLTHLPKRLLPWWLRRRHAFDPTARLTPIPLVHPSIPLDAPGSPFRLRRLDVFAPPADRFELVVCMNLLLPRYFAGDQIERGIRNLMDHLADGGTLLVGGTDAFRILRSRPGDPALQWTCRSFGGCGACRRIPGARPPAAGRDGAEAARTCGWAA
jgi:hypothetical protein